MTTPRTKAGRALLEREALNSRSFPLITADIICAIEEQASQPVDAILSELENSTPETREAAVSNAIGMLRALPVPASRPTHREASADRPDGGARGLSRYGSFGEPRTETHPKAEALELLAAARMVVRYGPSEANLTNLRARVERMEKAAALPVPASREAEGWTFNGTDVRRPRYRHAEAGMVLDPKGAYVLAHMVPPVPASREPDISVERLARALAAAHVPMPEPRSINDPGGTPLRRRQAEQVAAAYLAQPEPREDVGT